MSVSDEKVPLLTEDYRNAPSGIGPQAEEWEDKPHRLVYDLCREVERLRAVVDRLVSGMRHPDRCPASYGPMHRCDCGVQRLIDEVSK